MGTILKRSSYSPIIREMEDFSCALFTPSGDSVAQDDRIPAQLGAMSLAVKACISQHDEAGRVRDGDVFLLNHPYMGCMHTPDLNVVMPVVVDGKLFAWVGATAHHVDLGGPTPGTLAAHHRELFAEGLVLPPVHLYVAGEENHDLVQLISANVRDPVALIADLRAQHAACLVGSRALLQIVQRYGSEAVTEAFRQILHHTETTTRQALAALPDGSSEADGFLDDDGVGGPPTRIHVLLRKHRDHLIVDFSGSSIQVDGALNVPWASTRACVAYLVRTMICTGAEANDGMMRCVDIEAPRGSLLNPNPPAAVSVRHNTCQRVADTLVRAASQLWPDHAVASSSVSFFGLQIGSTSPRTGRTAVLMECVGGGTGAHEAGNGLDGVDTYMSNVGLLPVEVAETDYNVRIRRSAVIDGSEGTGLAAGGEGLLREYVILEAPQLATMYCEQSLDAHRPLGASGGGDGSHTKVTVLDAGGKTISTQTKATLLLEPGSVIRVETSGGGGYGRPD
jgi:N-methylhydantoinase B